MKKTSGLILSVASLAAFSLPAAAETRFDYDNGVSLILYGQLNPAFLSFDDGQNTTEKLVDSSHSNSRIGLWLRQSLETGELAFNLETGFGFRPSAGVSQNVELDAWNWERRNIRKIDLSFKTNAAGTFYVGQGSMANDGTAEADLSGTTLVVYASVPDSAGAFLFRNSDGDLSKRTIGGSFGDFDGGRLGRVRYDTPVFNGFYLSASYGEEILIDGVDLTSASVALHYSDKIGAYEIAGGLGYADVDPGPNVDSFTETTGSLSVLHDSGFNVTVASGRREDQGHYGYGKLGYIGNWFAFGSTAIAVDYYRGSDRTVSGSTSKAVGLGVVQRIDPANVEVYLGLRDYELSEPGESYQDASSVLFGARWKF